ncbi:MAG: hypothetical protein IPL63_11090 [Saprospiraceae bacterium]|nr:hypothetical protein [Saprospiraceae bacterium]
MDSLVCKNDTCLAYIFTGNEYSFMNLEPDTTGISLYEKILRLKDGNYIK